MDGSGFIQNQQDFMFSVVDMIVKPRPLTKNLHQLSMFFPLFFIADSSSVGSTSSQPAKPSSPSDPSTSGSNLRTLLTTGGVHPEDANDKHDDKVIQKKPEATTQQAIKPPQVSPHITRTATGSLRAKANNAAQKDGDSTWRKLWLFIVPFGPKEAPRSP